MSCFLYGGDRIVTLPGDTVPTPGRSTAAPIPGTPLIIRRHNGGRRAGREKEQ
ncbi:hypothetical protein GCM10010251_12650 [Streptomyces aurantiogriseus]|uniref:Uncharacterized protein n=1 Tax=Streptomyces aurantiogriseus TaxID=66870 RepID=A0A918BYH6_9ACTN|nr:hypothetical protein GCM10010251_12650 [Streptomyces aurantiogriseus]